MRYIAENGHQRYEIELDAFTKDVELSSDMKRRFVGLSTIFKNIDNYAWFEVAVALNEEYMKALEDGRKDKHVQELMNDMPTLESTKRWYCLPNTPENMAERMYRDDLEKWEKKLHSTIAYRRIDHIQGLRKIWQEGGSKKLKQIRVFSDRKKYSMDKVPNLC